MSYCEKPKLRFNKFKTTWKEYKLSELGEFKNGINKSADDFGHGYPFLNLMDVFGRNSITKPNLDLVNSTEKERQIYSIKKGDTFFIRSSVKRDGVGETAVCESDIGDTVYSGFLIRFRSNELIDNAYKRFCFWTPQFRNSLIRLSTTSANTNINQESLSKLKVILPSIEEQQKIAEFLSSVDNKISLLKEKHALLTEYKKGVMQKLFKQEIRFKDNCGNDFSDWQEQRFEQVFERITRKNKEDNKNVLTISAQEGLINQEKYFNKSVSAKDVTGYYLLEKGDFAYNKSYSKGYPMGAIKRLNNYDKGVVSTLYICFKSHGEQHDEFWEQYFEAGNLNREINKIAQEGARNHGLLNVSVTEFFHDVKVVAPCAEEQQKIADFLQALDKKLDAVNQQIELTQTFKKGLLQQMFV